MRLKRLRRVRVQFQGGRRFRFGLGRAVTRVQKPAQGLVAVNSHRVDQADAETRLVGQGARRAFIETALKSLSREIQGLQADQVGEQQMPPGLQLQDQLRAQLVLAVSEPVPLADIQGFAAAVLFLLRLFFQLNGGDARALQILSVAQPQVRVFDQADGAVRGFAVVFEAQQPAAQIAGQMAQDLFPPAAGRRGVVLAQLHGLHKMTGGVLELLPLRGQGAVLDQHQLGAVIPGAFQKLADGAGQFVVLQARIDHQGGVAPGGQRAQARLLHFRQALHHALGARCVAFIGGNQLPGDGRDIDALIPEPLQGFLYRALYALFHDLPGAVEAYLPAHGAVLQRVQELVHGMLAGSKEMLALQRNGHGQRQQPVNLLVQRAFERVAFFPVRERFTHPGENRVMFIAQGRAPLVPGRLSFDRRQGRGVGIFAGSQIGEQILVAQGLLIALRLLRRKALDNAIAQRARQGNVFGG